jgi:hypothetical protein
VHGHSAKNNATAAEGGAADNCKYSTRRRMMSQRTVRNDDMSNYGEERKSVKGDASIELWKQSFNKQSEKVVTEKQNSEKVYTEKVYSEKNVSPRPSVPRERTPGRMTEARGSMKQSEERKSMKVSEARGSYKSVRRSHKP